MEGQDMTDYSELVKDLRDTERVCRDRMDGQVMLDAAAAIEALQATIELMKPYMPYFFPDANKVTLPKMEVQE